MNPPRRVLVCTCSHHKKDHYGTKQSPNGPCQYCPCAAFTPEKICKCNHGKKAHQKGYCHESDGCKVFRPSPDRKEERPPEAPEPHKG